MYLKILHLANVLITEQIGNNWLTMSSIMALMPQSYLQRNVYRHLKRMANFMHSSHYMSITPAQRIILKTGHYDPDPYGQFTSAKNQPTYVHYFRFAV